MGILSYVTLSKQPSALLISYFCCSVRMQEPNADQDEEFCSLVQQLINMGNGIPLFPMLAILEVQERPTTYWIVGARNCASSLPAPSTKIAQNAIFVSEVRGTCRWQCLRGSAYNLGTRRGHELVSKFVTILAMALPWRWPYIFTESTTSSASLRPT